MLEIMNEETEYKYSEVINFHMMRNKKENVYRKVLIGQSLEASDYDVIKETNLAWKIKILMCLKFPKITAFLKKVKRSIRK